MSETSDLTAGERVCRYPCGCDQFPEEHCACMDGDVKSLRTVLADHFVMWRDLPHAVSTTIPSPPGEWFCQCGLKFGFSDTAIDHQIDMLAARLDTVRRATSPEGSA